MSNELISDEEFISKDENLEELEEELLEEDFDNEEDEDDENLEENYDQSYNVPKDQDAFINTKDGQVINRDDLSPLQIIQAIAQKSGIEINDPKPSCKSCHGKGYTGIDSETRSPIACKCIYSKEDLKKQKEEPSFKINRNIKRRFESLAKRQEKKKKRNEIKKQKRQQRIQKKKNKKK